MSDNPLSWAEAIGLPPDVAASFTRLAASLDSTPAEVLRQMVARVIALDRTLGAQGLAGFAAWTSKPEAVQATVDHALGGLPLDIRPSHFMWPPEKPFPWTADECRAAVIGYEVKWKGEFDDFLNLLRGKWEMADGYAFLHQT